MSFASRTDYFGVSTGTNSSLEITSSTRNKSLSTAEARNEKGDVVAQETFGETSAPSCTYVLKDNWTLADIVLGEVFTYEQGSNELKFVYSSVKIDTAAGTPPTVTYTGEEVTDATEHSDCKVTVSGASELKFCHHAQNVFNAYTLDSTSALKMNMISCSTTIQGSLTKATQDGKTITYDIIDCKIIVEVTLQSAISDGWTDPTVTPTTGWTITSPVTISEPDSDYPTWTFTVEKPLSHDTEPTDDDDTTD